MSDQTPPIPEVMPPLQRPILRRLSPTAFAVVALAIIFVLYQIVGGVITMLMVGGEITPETVTGVRWITLVGQVAFILVPTIVLARLRYPGVKGFFRVKPVGAQELALTLIAVFALQQVLQGYLVLQSAIPLPAGLEEIVSELKRLIEQAYRVLVSSQSLEEFLFVVLVIAVTPAVCEELLFRGLIQRSIEEGAGGVRGAVAAGIIFGVYHLNPFTVVALIALGVFFGLLVYRTGNITLAIVAHFFNNVVAAAAMYMQLDDDFIVVAPTESPTGLLVLFNSLLFALVFVGSVYCFVRVTQPQTNGVSGT